MVIKSVYDPSPVGYSLPASNAFTGFTTTGGNVNNWPNPFTPETKSKFNIKGDFDKGWYFYTKPNKQGEIFFFQASGWRISYSGSLEYVPTHGYYWVAIPNTIPNRGRNLGFNFQNVFPLDFNYNNSFGLAVRSAEEKEENVTIFQHLRFVFYYIQKRTSYLSYLLYINYFIFYPVLSYYDGISISLCNVPFYTDYLEMACMGP